MNLSSHIRRLDTRFLALSKRERLIILILTLALLLAVAQFTVFVPIQSNIKAQELEQVKLRSLNEQMENEFAQLQNFVAGQQDVAQVLELEQQLADVNAKVLQLGNRMVEPSQMATLLQQLLSKESGMRVIALEKLPLQQDKLDSKGEPAKPDDHRLYRHKVRLTLHGNYLECLRYLQKMEALPWQVFWDAMHYRVDKYPNAYVTIEIATLASDKGWIGG